MIPHDNDCKWKLFRLIPVPYSVSFQNTKKKIPFVKKFIFQLLFHLKAQMHTLVILNSSLYSSLSFAHFPCLLLSDARVRFSFVFLHRALVILSLLIDGVKFYKEKTQQREAKKIVLYKSSVSYKRSFSMNIPNWNEKP